MPYDMSACLSNQQWPGKLREFLEHFYVNANVREDSFSRYLMHSGIGIGIGYFTLYPIGKIGIGGTLLWI